MSDKTPRFGFSFYGGAVPGSLTDDGNAFTLRDPVATDKILAALEGHEHISTNPGHQVPDPSGMPDLTLLTGGTIAAGQTLYYVVTFVDRFGLETAAGDEISIETGAVILSPGSPDAETAVGGALTPGLYYYAVTALDGENETTLSAPEMATVTEAEGTVLLNLPDIPEGADSLRVWRQGPGEGTYSRLAVATDVIFEDDGTIPPDPCPWDPSHQPPSENTTRQDGAVQVNLAPEDVAVLNDPAQRITAWRIYRSTVSGTYTASSLAAEVVDRVSEDPTSAFVTVWIDDGAALLAGSPPQVTQTLREPSSITFPVADELPSSTTGYPENYPLIVGDKLYVKRGTEWVMIAGGGGASAGIPQRAGLDSIYTDRNDGSRWVGTVFEDLSGNKMVGLEPTVLPGGPAPVVTSLTPPTLLAWMPPPFDGGLPLLGYTVWVLGADGTRWTSETPTTVTTFDLGLLWDGSIDAWAWVTARNAQGHSRADQTSIIELHPGDVVPTDGPPGWAPDTAEDLFWRGPTAFATDSSVNWDTIDTGMPTDPVWNFAPGRPSGQQATYYRYRPLQAGTLEFDVTANLPDVGDWYVDLLVRPRDGSLVDWPGDSELFFSDNYFTGDETDTASGTLSIALEEDLDYWIVVSTRVDGASGQITVTSGGYDWSVVGQAQVMTRDLQVLWHSREEQAGDPFGGWVCFDNDFGAGYYLFTVGFEDDPGSQTPLTMTAYSYGGSGFPDDPSDLTLIAEIWSGIDEAVSAEQALPAGRIWLHLEQDAVGWGHLLVEQP